MIGGQKLIEKIAVCCMNFNARKTSFFRNSCRFAISAIKSSISVTSSARGWVKKRFNTPVKGTALGATGSFEIVFGDYFPG